MRMKRNTPSQKITFIYPGVDLSSSHPAKARIAKIIIAANNINL